MTLQIEMEGDLPALFAALAIAQGTMELVAKDAANGAFKREGKVLRYATLGAAVSAIVPALSAQGIAVMQFPHDGNDGKGVRIATMLAHKNGGWIRATLSVPVAAVTAQGLGSAITYGRRYTLLAIVAQAPDDDDDGAEASAQAPRPTASVNRQPVPTSDDKAAANLEMAAARAEEIVRRLGQASSQTDVAEIMKASGPSLARLDAGYPELRQRVRDAESGAKHRLAPANGANGHHPDGIAV